MAGSTQQAVTVQSEAANALQEGEIVDGTHVAAAGTETTATTEEAAAFPPFESEFFAGQLLWLAITFVALYVIMSCMALPRIGSILESRRTRIEGDLKEAERLRVETERAAQAYQQALADARANAHKIAEETRNSIKADIDGKRADVEADLGKRIAEAEARIAATKATALGNVDSIAADTAAAVVERLAGKVSAAQAKSAVETVTKELAS